MHYPTSLLKNALIVLATTLLLCHSPVGAQVTAPAVKPAGGLWDSGAGFQFDLGKKKVLKTRQSVSGIACNLDARQRRICLVVFDEGAQARYAYVKDGLLVPELEPVLFRGIDGELDAEAAATDGRYFYVSGSHSAKRSDCSSNPDSRHVIRMALDPVTGRAVQAEVVDTGRLWQLMQTRSELQPYVGERKCLGTAAPPKAPKLAGQQGINIEGMAVKGGRLFWGFRGPVVKGVALVLAVNADVLFRNAAPRPAELNATVTRLGLGERRGIRDMVAVSDGLLLLAGPDDDDASRSAGWEVFWWDGKPGQDVVQPRLLATLDLSPVKLRPCDETLKPEAITVLEEAPKAYKLLVLSDGMCDGGAMVFSIPKP
jgi:hypothetical protein